MSLSLSLSLLPSLPLPHLSVSLRCSLLPFLIFCPLFAHSVILRPNGSLIGSTQQKPHRHDVVFFERNGLQHGEFPLVATPLLGSNGDAGRQLHVQEMMWSSDSSVLALWIIRKKKNLQQRADGDDAFTDSRETCGI